MTGFALVDGGDISVVAEEADILICSLSAQSALEHRSPSQVTRDVVAAMIGDDHREKRAPFDFRNTGMTC